MRLGGGDVEFSRLFCDFPRRFPINACSYILPHVRGDFKRKMIAQCLKFTAVSEKTQKNAKKPEKYSRTSCKTQKHVL
jgi:hypothetical protein